MTDMPKRIWAENVRGQWYTKDELYEEEPPRTEYIRADLVPDIDVEALVRERSKILTVAADLVRNKPLEPEDIPTADRVMSEACISLRNVFDEIGRILTEAKGGASWAK